MNKIYNKLVRDKVPDIIKDNRQVPEYKILSDEEYILELDKKLKEETAEYQESKEVEDLADILEVVYAICRTKGVSEEKIQKIREEKARKRGGFQNKILLKTVKKSL